MKIKKLSVVCLILVLVLLLPLFAACDDGLNGKTKITFWGWGSPAEKKVYQALVDQYMAENEDIVVAYTNVESTIYMNNFRNETNKPDVFYMPDTDFLAWADAGVMLNVLPYCTQEELDSVWSEAVNEYYYNFGTQTLGKSAGAELLGFPKDLGPVTLVYNETLLDQQIAKNELDREAVYALLSPTTPMTWDQFRNLLKDLTKDQDKNSAQQIYGLPYYETDTAVYSNNADYFYDDATKQGIDQNFIDAITFIIQLATVDKVMPSAALSGSTDAYTRFLDNKSIFTWMGPWDNADFWEYQSLKYNVIPVPYGPAEGASSVSFIGSMCYGVSAKSKHKEEAVKFAKWLSMSEACQRKSMELGQQVPNIVSMVDDYVSADWEVQPANRSVFVDIIDGTADSLKIYENAGKTDVVSGKTRALYYTYDSTWKDNFFAYMDKNNMWKLSSAAEIKNLLEAYRDDYQHDLDNMNNSFRK